MNATHYLCDTNTGKISFAGVLPETWGTLSSLPPAGDPDLLDLGWAGHPHQGFFTFQQAVNAGINQAELAKMRVTVLDLVWRDIQAFRDQKYLGGALVSGKWFHTDDSSRAKYLELKDQARDVIAAGGSMASSIIGSDGNQREWKTKDGSYIAMTCQLAFDVVDAARNHHDSVFTAAERHRLAMSEAVDPILYDFSKNWPASFGA